MKSISAVVLASALFLGMSCLANVQLINEKRAPVTFTLVKVGTEVPLAPSDLTPSILGKPGVKFQVTPGLPARTYNLKDKEIKNLASLEDGNGYYFVQIKSQKSELASKTKVPLTGTSKIFAKKDRRTGKFTLVAQ